MKDQAAICGCSHMWIKMVPKSYQSFRHGQSLHDGFIGHDSVLIWNNFVRFSFISHSIQLYDWSTRRDFFFPSKNKLLIMKLCAMDTRPTDHE